MSLLHDHKHVEKRHSLSVFFTIRSMILFFLSPQLTMLNLTTVAPWLQNPGVYGPVTATLDWCEVCTTAAATVLVCQSHTRHPSSITSSLHTSPRWPTPSPISSLLDSPGSVLARSNAKDCPCAITWVTGCALFFPPRSKTINAYLKGCRARWFRQLPLPRNTALRSPARRRTTHDLRRLLGSFLPIRQQTRVRPPHSAHQVPHRLPHPV